MPRYRKYVTVTVGAGSEVLVPALISTQAEPKSVDAVVPSTGADNIDLLVYLEREKLIDYPVDILNAQERVVDVGVDLPVGQQLYVGFRNKTTSSIQADIGIIYRIGRG